VSRAVDAGAPLVQVRHKEGTDRARLAATGAIVERCRAAGAMCLVNDRVDLALATGAAGVHLGAEDLPVDVARRLLGDHAVVGGTARDPDGARRAEDAGATYLGVGPCYPTTSKTGLPEPGGPARVEAVARAVSIPVIAISGVTVERVPELIDAGAWGVAVLGAVHAAADPAAMVATFLSALGEDPS
jgi:thiamine-phosphate pyrophosphorylase